MYEFNEKMGEMGEMPSCLNLEGGVQSEDPTREKKRKVAASAHSDKCNEKVGDESELASACLNPERAHQSELPAHAIGGPIALGPEGRDSLDRNPSAVDAVVPTKSSSVPTEDGSSCIENSFHGGKFRGMCRADFPDVHSHGKEKNVWVVSPTDEELAECGLLLDGVATCLSDNLDALIEISVSSETSVVNVQGGRVGMHVADCMVGDKISSPNIWMRLASSVGAKLHPSLERKAPTLEETMTNLGLHSLELHPANEQSEKKHGRKKKHKKKRSKK